MEKIYDFIVVGSGAGGGTLAYELSKFNKNILVIEKGKYENELGGKKNFSRYVDIVKSLEGINIMRAIMAGGTTVISAGNIVRCLESELKEKGIDLEEEFKDAEKELNLMPLSTKLMSESSTMFQGAARKLGYNFEPMPKCLDQENCNGCGLCITGCGLGHKWTSLDYLDKAIKNEVEAAYGANVTKIEPYGEGHSVICMLNGEETSFKARCVILAAGGLSTPVILQRSGIDEAGKNLSVDLLKHVYGFIPGKEFGAEPPMSMVDTEFLDERGFILSTNTNLSVVKKYVQSQEEGFPYSINSAIGIMIKIKDCPNGIVFPDGTVSKDVDVIDMEKFEFASKVIRDILLEIGADRNHIFESHINGAHPLGTAAIGAIVDENLMTSTEGLYVCDASVFPAVPGLPPMLTIVALAKRLGKYLNLRYQQ